MVPLGGAQLLEHESRGGRKARPWIVFSALGALAVAALVGIVVRAIPQDPQPIRDPLRLPRQLGDMYSLDLVDQISAAQAAGLTSEPWRLVAIDGRPRSLQIFYVVGGGCETPVGIRVHETRTSVTIEAVSRTDPNASACASLLKTGSGSVILKQPLGDRTLWHAPVAEEQAGPFF